MRHGHVHMLMGLSAGVTRKHTHTHIVLPHPTSTLLEQAPCARRRPELHDVLEVLVVWVLLARLLDGLAQLGDGRQLAEGPALDVVGAAQPLEHGAAHPQLGGRL